MDLDIDMLELLSSSPRSHTSIDSFLTIDSDGSGRDASSITEVSLSPPLADTPLHRIDTTLRTLAANAAAGASIELELKRRSGATTLLPFPGRTVDQAWRFTVVLRILELMRDSLLANKIITKRDMFYRDPALFGNQATVDRYVEDIAHTLGVARAALNVTAASKGLLYGPAIFLYHNGSSATANNSTQGLLMPESSDIASVDLSAVQWILIVEKEATFRSIIACMSFDSELARGLVITAKGYPDIASQEVVNLLAMPTAKNGFTTNPLLALVDYDPDGFNIYGCYKYKASGNMSANLTRALSRMRLVGLFSHHISTFEQSNTAGSILVMTSRDRVRAVNMLSNSQVGKEDVIRTELQRMLMLNMKVELQHVDDSDDQLREFLKQHVSS